MRTWFARSRSALKTIGYYSRRELSSGISAIERLQQKIRERGLSKPPLPAGTLSPGLKKNSGGDVENVSKEEDSEVADLDAQLMLYHSEIKAEEYEEYEDLDEEDEGI